MHTVVLPLSQIPAFSGGCAVCSLFCVPARTPTWTIWTPAVWTATPVNSSTSVNPCSTTSGIKKIREQHYLLRCGETGRFAESVLIEIGDFLWRFGDLNCGERWGDKDCRLPGERGLCLLGDGDRGLRLTGDGDRGLRLTGDGDRCLSAGNLCRGGDLRRAGDGDLLGARAGDRRR